MMTMDITIKTKHADGVPIRGRIIKLFPNSFFVRISSKRWLEFPNMNTSRRVGVIGAKDKESRLES